MTLAHRYQKFGATEARSAPEETAGAEQLEEEKLQSFENGYQSGWDDAVAAQGTTRDNVTAEFARNLQEASFAYHEARTALARELRDLVEPLLGELLPLLARETLALHVLDIVSSAAKKAMDQPIEIVVAPNRVLTLEALFEASLTEPFEIRPDDTMDQDQVFLRLGSQEQEIDFQPWLEQVNASLASYLDTIGKG